MRTRVLSYVGWSNRLRGVLHGNSTRWNLEEITGTVGILSRDPFCLIRLERRSTA